jgi:hypothetical protein
MENDKESYFDEFGTDLYALDFVTPQGNQGQIMRVSYAMDEDGHYVYRRTYDRSDGTLIFDRSKALSDDDGDYYSVAPLNKTWREIFRDVA